MHTDILYPNNDPKRREKAIADIRAYLGSSYEEKTKQFREWYHHEKRTLSEKEADNFVLTALSISGVWGLPAHVYLEDIIKTNETRSDSEQDL